MFDNLLPKDPGKRDLAIVALIVVPLMAIGVIWGILGDFDDGSPAATPVPTPPLVQSTPSASPSPAASPAAFIIVEAA